MAGIIGAVGMSNAYNFLFQMEDIMIEELVQLLVGEVDAELLEGVDLIK